VDEDLREALRRYVSAREPAVSLTSTYLIRRGSRGRRIRAAASMTGGAVAAVAVASLVLVSRAGDEPINDLDSAPTTSATPSTALSIRDQEAARLTGVLDQLMAELQPQANYVPNADIPLGGAGKPTDTPLKFVDEDSFFFTSADIKDSAGTGSIRVLSGMLDAPYRASGTCPEDPPPKDVTVSCDTQPLPGGGRIMRLTSTIGGRGKNILVELVRADGNSVSVQNTNFSGIQGEDQSYRPTTPLTLAQTVALAQEPALATTLR
jgi:hypothetical protein